MPDEIRTLPSSHLPHPCLNQALLIASLLLGAERLPEAWVLWTFAHFRWIPRYFNGITALWISSRSKEEFGRYLRFVVTIIEIPQPWGILQVALRTLWSIRAKSKVWFCFFTAARWQWLAAVTWKSWAIQQDSEVRRLIWLVLMWSQEVRCGWKVGRKTSPGFGTDRRPCLFLISKSLEEYLRSILEDRSVAPGLLRLWQRASSKVSILGSMRQAATWQERRDAVLSWSQSRTS